jgi:threonine synthase
LGLIDRLPRLAVIQAEGASPFYELVQAVAAGDGTAQLHPVEHPETLATAIKIGDPVSWPKALHEITASRGVVERVSEAEIADAKAVIGRSGIGCEPASAATLAGIRRLTAAGVLRADADVVAVLTGNVLKDPDYVQKYHSGVLEAGSGKIRGSFPNPPVYAPYDIGVIRTILGN